jgi:HD-GYP domain-containing protein (c-di-GMP phosphodiesterase class II)
MPFKTENPHPSRAKPPGDGGRAAPAPLQDASSLPVPAQVLEVIAERFRPGGLFLLALRNDGSVAWHDPSAGMFFQRFVLPLLRLSKHAAPSDAGDSAAPGPLLPAIVAGGPCLWQMPEGIALAAFPHLERKQQSGVLLLAAKASSWQPGAAEDVLRACGRLQLDVQWLAGEAAILPAYDDAALEHQARLLTSALRDQLTLAGLEDDRNNLSEQLSNTYEELSLIYQISGGMKVNRQASDFFRQTCLDVLEVVDVRGMGVALFANLSDQPPPALYGRMELPAAAISQLCTELMAVLRERKSPLLINDLRVDPAFAWLAGHARQLLAVPLQRQDQVLGCLFAVDKQSGDFDSVDSKLLNSIANESAIYLENSMLFEDVHGLMMGLLHSLTSAVDAKDAYTCGHSERVALLSRYLAQEIHLGDQQVEQIYMAGLLHDVGKIGVPESVLQKPGRLTVEEFEQMKKHVRIGARILSDVKQVKALIPGVLYHHERYDGKGYPEGLSGERIPLMGRIICLADCFDAMTSSRTYRKALPLEVALCEIRRCSGTQFDPFLAEAFLRTRADKLRELLRDHQDKSKRLLDLQETLSSGRQAAA